MDEPKGILFTVAGKPTKSEPDEKPERFVTSDAEAMHAATIRSACAALNDVVKAAAKDGLIVTYEGQYADGWGMWMGASNEDGAVPAIALKPMISRKL